MQTSPPSISRILFIFQTETLRRWNKHSAVHPTQPRPKQQSPFYFLFLYIWLLFRSDQISLSVVSDSLRPHEPQHVRLPWPSPTPGVHPNPWTLSQWCRPAISSSVIPFSSCPQFFPASGSFQMSLSWLKINLSFILPNIVYKRNHLVVSLSLISLWNSCIYIHI